MSTVLEFTGTPEGIARLRKALEEGRLTELAGHKILAFDVVGLEPDVSLDLDDLQAQSIAQKDEE